MTSFADASKPSAFGGSSTAFGSGFGGPIGNKLNSFAAPVAGAEIVGAKKEAKPFGAPESDKDDSASDDGESEGGARSDDEESLSPVEEKKKPKIKKGTYIQKHRLPLGYEMDSN